jgi:hypothetical protein
MRRLIPLLTRVWSLRQLDLRLIHLTGLFLLLALLPGLGLAFCLVTASAISGGHLGGSDAGLLSGAGVLGGLALVV